MNEKQTQILSLLKLIFNDSNPTMVRNNTEAMFFCPSKQCNSQHHKRKLTVNLETGAHQCWVCGFMSRNLNNIIFTLKPSQQYVNKFKELEKKYKLNVYDDKFKSTKKSFNGLKLPPEFTSFMDGNVNSIKYQNALKYLKKRGIKQEDILRHNIGFCEKGKYSDMFIIPSYDENNHLNFYSARSFMGYKRVLDAPVSKDVIGFENLINWNLPIIICEAALGAISIGYNSIPLYGKKIKDELIFKMVYYEPPEVILMLDSDAFLKALKQAEYLLHMGLNVSIVELPEDEDPSSLGTDKIDNLLKTSKYPVTDSYLLKKRILLQ